MEAGRYAEAARAGRRGSRAATRAGIQAAPVLRTAARIAMTSGDLTAAWEHCEQARLVVEAEDAPVAWLREVLETTAEVELWAGRPEAAYDVVLDGLELVAGTDEEAVRHGAGGPRRARARGRRRRAPRTTAPARCRESQRRRLLAAIEAVRRHPGAGGQPERRGARPAGCGPSSPGSTRLGTWRRPRRRGRPRPTPGTDLARPLPSGVRALAGGRGPPGRWGRTPRRWRRCARRTPPRWPSAPRGWSRRSSPWRRGTAPTSCRAVRRADRGRPARGVRT